MKLVKDNQSDNISGLLGKGMEVKGDIIFTDRLQVEGKIVGKLISEKGTLIIGETGRVEAQVEVSVCVIHGTLQGNVDARSRVEIRKTSRVSGDLTTPVMLIEEGAVFNGTIGMEQATGLVVERIRPKEEEEKLRAKGV